MKILIRITTKEQLSQGCRLSTFLSENTENMRVFFIAKHGSAPIYFSKRKSPWGGDNQYLSFLPSSFHNSHNLL